MTDPGPTVDVVHTEYGTVTIMISGDPSDVGAVLRATALDGWPLPDRVPDDLLQPAGWFGALPLAAQVARLTLTVKEVGEPPPTVRWLLRRLSREVAPLSRQCICGAPAWTWCRSSSGTPTGSHAFRRAIPSKEER